MEEIKFRAYEKNLNEIIPVHNIDFKDRIINKDIAYRTFDEVELMQYATEEYVDCNWVRLCEWDIVARKRMFFKEENPPNWLYNISVSFTKKWERVLIWYEYYMYFTTLLEMYTDINDRDYWYSSTDLLIIWNIHKNPELMPWVRHPL